MREKQLPSPLYLLEDCRTFASTRTWRGYTRDLGRQFVQKRIVHAGLTAGNEHPLFRQIDNVDVALAQNSERDWRRLWYDHYNSQLLARFFLSLLNYFPLYHNLVRYNTLSPPAIYFPRINTSLNYKQDCPSALLDRNAPLLA